MTRRAFRTAAVICALCLPALAGCAYIDRARSTGDLAVATSQFYKLEALAQLDVERRRLRSARCYSPLLTPATISAAAADNRLGLDWVDELLSDCPQFAAFLSDLMFRRGLSAYWPPVSEPAYDEEDPALSRPTSDPAFSGKLIREPPA